MSVSKRSFQLVAWLSVLWRWSLSQLRVTEAGLRLSSVSLQGAGATFPIRFIKNG
jgi:hypothetical protein